MLHIPKLVRRRVAGTPFSASPRLLSVPLLALLGGVALMLLR